MWQMTLPEKGYLLKEATKKNSKTLFFFQKMRKFAILFGV